MDITKTELAKNLEYEVTCTMPFKVCSSPTFSLFRLSLNESAVLILIRINGSERSNNFAVEVLVLGGKSGNSALIDNLEEKSEFFK